MKVGDSWKIQHELLQSFTPLLLSHIYLADCLSQVKSFGKLNANDTEKLQVDEMATGIECLYKIEFHG